MAQNRPHKKKPGDGATLSVTELGSVLESLYAGLVGERPGRHSSTGCARCLRRRTSR